MTGAMQAGAAAGLMTTLDASAPAGIAADIPADIAADVPGAGVPPSVTRDTSTAFQSEPGQLLPAKDGSASPPGTPATKEAVASADKTDAIPAMIPEALAPALADGATPIASEGILPAENIVASPPVLSPGVRRANLPTAEAAPARLTAQTPASSPANHSVGLAARRASQLTFGRAVGDTPRDNTQARAAPAAATAAAPPGQGAAQTPPGIAGPASGAAATPEVQSIRDPRATATTEGPIPAAGAPAQTPAIRPDQRSAQPALPQSDITRTADTGATDAKPGLAPGPHPATPHQVRPEVLADAQPQPSAFAQAPGDAPTVALGRPASTRISPPPGRNPVEAGQFVSAEGVTQNLAPSATAAAAADKSARRSGQAKLTAPTAQAAVTGDASASQATPPPTAPTSTAAHASPDPVVGSAATRLALSGQASLRRTTDDIDAGSSTVSQPGANRLSMTGPDRPTSHQPPAQIARSVAVQLADSLSQDAPQSVEIRLDPRELGHVRLTLSLSEHGASIAMTAERPETLELMRRHAGILSQEFSRLGYGEVGFSFAQSGQHSGGEHTTASGAPPPGQTPLETTTPTSAIAARATPAARSGGLDIRL